jgi:NADH dehydrogenase
VPNFRHDLAARKESKGEASAASGEHYKVNYDKLVIAVGCYSQDFGIPGVSSILPFMWLDR